MARAKSSTAQTPAPVAETPVPVATDAKKSDKSVRVKKEKVAETPASVATPVVSETVVVTPVAVAPVAEAQSGESRDDRHKALLASIDAQIASLKTLRSSLLSSFKADAVELKAAQKSNGRRRRATSAVPSEKKVQSGITKPTKVSDAMCEFLGREKGSLIARTEVTKFITNYIRDNNLKDAKVRRHINPDTRLRSLLNIPTSDQLTYFNLQKYMSSHFPKAVATA